MDCIFCRIVSGETPAHIVYKDQDVMAILDVGHVNPGHTLVLPKIHVETLEDADEDLAAHVFRIANRIAKALKVAHPAEGSTILQANRAAGFQTVPHFHVHVLPRNSGDGVDLIWPVKNPLQEELAINAQALKAALEAI